jgi:hypothetical protein
MSRMQDIHRQVGELAKQVTHWHSIFKDSRGEVESNARRNRERALSEMSQLREEAFQLSGGNTQAYQQIDDVVGRAYAFNS